MPLTVYTLRAVENFAEAAKNFGMLFDDRVFFIYDPCNLQTPSDLARFLDKNRGQYDRVFYSIPRCFTSPLNRKDSFGNRALVFNSKFVPETYFMPMALPLDCPKQIWYVKNSYETDGKDIILRRTEDLLKCSEWDSKYIIQKAVTDILTYEGRKYSIRAHVIFWGGKVYLYKDATLFVHGEPYDPNSLDYNVQVKHADYMDKVRTITLRCLSDIPQYKDLFFNMKLAISEMKLYAADIIGQTTLNSYCILGIDFLPLQSGSVVLVEVNDIPSVEDTKVINARINIPMLHDAMRIITQCSNINGFEII